MTRRPPMAWLALAVALAVSASALDGIGSDAFPSNDGSQFRVKVKDGPAMKNRPKVDGEDHPQWDELLAEMRQILRDHADVPTLQDMVHVKGCSPIAEKGACKGGTEGKGWNFQATIQGPEGTLTAGVPHTVSLVIPPEYPARAPTVQFLNTMHHHQLDEVGSPRREFYHPPSLRWNPSTSGMRVVLQSVAAMLWRPFPMSPEPPNMHVRVRWEREGHEILKSSGSAQLRVIRAVQEAWAAESRALFGNRTVARRESLDSYQPVAAKEIFGPRGAWPEEWVQPMLGDAMAKAREPKEELLASLSAWRSVDAGVWAVPLLAKEATLALLEEYLNFMDSGLRFTPPTSRQNGGATLSSMGAEWAVKSLVTDLLAPLAAALNVTAPGDGIHQQHSYIFSLQAPNSTDAADGDESESGGEDDGDGDEGDTDEVTLDGRGERALDVDVDVAPRKKGPEAVVPSEVAPHWDDAEVTVSVLLGGMEWKGGDYVVCFQDLIHKPRGRLPKDEHTDGYDECECRTVPVRKAGTAVIHRGALVHGWSDVTEGTVYVLELWGQSMSARAAARATQEASRAPLPLEAIARAHAPMPSTDAFMDRHEARPGGAPWDDENLHGTVKRVKINDNVASRLPGAEEGAGGGGALGEGLGLPGAGGGGDEAAPAGPGRVGHDDA